MHKATEFRLEAHPLLPEPLERLPMTCSTAGTMGFEACLSVLTYRYGRKSSTTQSFSCGGLPRIDSMKRLKTGRFWPSIVGF